MTKSEAGELARNARVLQKAARLPAALQEAQRLQEEANAALAEAEVLKPQARLDDLTACEGWRRSKQSRKGSRTYTYWMASWREDGKTDGCRRSLADSQEDQGRGDSMLIELTRGKHAIIDTADVDLAGRSWHAVPGHSSAGNYTFYAARRKGRRMRPYKRQRPEQQKMQSEVGGLIEIYHC